MENFKIWSFASFHREQWTISDGKASTVVNRPDQPCPGFEARTSVQLEFFVVAVAAAAKLMQYESTLRPKVQRAKEDTQLSSVWQIEEQEEDKRQT